MSDWRVVRKDLHSLPIVEGAVPGTVPVYFERYIFRGIDREVRGISTPTLVVQFGGSKATEGEQGVNPGEILPGRCGFFPSRYPTHWHYGGFVDFGDFYFPPKVDGVLQRLWQLGDARGCPIFFFDSLVASAALALADEVAKGSAMDEMFSSLLANVMFERTYRLLTASSSHNLNPRHIHFDRLQKSLSYVRENLASELTLDILAGHARVSVPHFQRIFNEAVGMSVHKYVLSCRLEKARNLLAMTQMPMSRIADECGFSSQSHMTKSFRAAHAATPSDFRALSSIRK